MPRRWVLVAETPFLPADGGVEQELLGMAVALASLGELAAVVVPARHPLPIARYTDVLGDLPILVARRSTRPTRLVHPRDPFMVASRPAAKSILADLAQLIPPADAVLVGAYKPHRLGRSIAEHLAIPAVVRMHNIEGDYATSLARTAVGARRAVLSLEAARVRRDEHRLGRASWVRGIADISRVDAAKRRLTATVPVVVVPPFSGQPSPGGTKAVLARIPVRGRVLFVGALDVATNHDALRWFLRDVWPRVLVAAPHATLVVAGRRPPAELVHRWSSVPGVSVHADVADMSPLLHSAAVALNPAVSGSGVNIKLVEYLRAGVPSVSTVAGAAGLDLEPGVHLLVADGAEPFASAIATLLSDARAAEAIGLAGPERVRVVLDGTAGVRSLDALIDGLG